MNYNNIDIEYNKIVSAIAYRTHLIKDENKDFNIDECIYKAIDDELIYR